MFNSERKRSESRYGVTRRTGMNNVVGDNIDIHKSVMRGDLHQLELAHCRETRRLPNPSRRQSALGNCLGIPIVGLKEQDLPTRLQQAIDRL